MTIAFFGCIFCVMSAGLAAAALSVVAFFVGRRSRGNADDASGKTVGGGNAPNPSAADAETSPRR